MKTSNAEMFAGRFSSEDWGQLCGIEKFRTAVRDGEFEVAEVIAHCHFQGRDRAEIAAGAQALVNWERHHRECADLVSAWAKATGRVGKDHKQSRQAKIRKLMKNGLQSDYARAVRAEAGMISE